MSSIMAARLVVAAASEMAARLKNECLSVFILLEF
jgi:hypothetical protein